MKLAIKPKKSDKPVTGKREYKDFVFVQDSEDPEVLYGYAATWAVDDYDDQIEPGAFLESIKRRHDTAMLRKGSSDIRFCYQHEKTQILGRVEEIREDEKGLFVKCRFLPTTLGNDIRILVAGKALDRLSIGYITIRAKRENGVRILLEIEIFEVSVVTIPGNDEALILGMKNLELEDMEHMEIKLTPERLEELASDAQLEIKAGKKMSRERKVRLKEAINTLNELFLSVEDDPQMETRSGGEVPEEKAKATCPECNGPMKDGKCEKCGHEMKDGGSGVTSDDDLTDPKRRMNPENAKSAEQEETSLEAKGENSLSPEDEAKLLEILNGLENKIDNLGKEMVH